MNEFHEGLKRNEFLCSQCTRCDKMVWPPSRYCDRCFSTVSWKRVSRDAVLIEVSCKDGEYFCIAELEGNIRVIGRVTGSGDLVAGQKLTLEKCDYDGNERYFFSVRE